ncbi:FtsX-like permease family protein [Hespellia stercorisuis]|uniref:FtsX-like permease family protein n=1 Tax=Hespellia stercorisuis DSM 15480 TaxID=1121950 RepID=A0A1M6UGL8_9FIRM|nr:FtsX-like permease family protein [Hespellia stercorisuis]SHK68364.1 FtsX-like permease family protein [Hespellia stercorisuis DSM 15480]
MKELCKKLAAQNLSKNRTIYLPYMMAQVLMVALFYNLLFLVGNKNILTLPGGESVQQTLAYGSLVMGVFVMTFLFYVNGVLMKQRKKEFGLYRVLGMEYQHLKKVVFYETCIANAISFAVGIVSGIVFSGLLYMILLKILGERAALAFGISISAIWYTLLLFGFLFVLVLFRNLRQLKRVKLREMLQAKEQGEQEPKTKKGLVVFGIFCLVIGYGIALLVQNIIASLFLFFVAAVFVIIGTYALFTAGSIIFLKKIKADKERYYTPRFFVAVSGLLHRMKQNAAGLAGICVLSTMILVTCSVSVSVYFGQEHAIRTMFPADIVVTMVDTTNPEQDMEYIKNQAELAAQQTGISVRDVKLAASDSQLENAGSGYETQNVQISLSGSEKEKNECSKELEVNTDDGVYTYQSAHFVCKQSPQEGAESIRATYGGFLFLGIFLGVMFMAATVLMIYYKQISEGYEDRQRYIIMKKVGMSDEEVRESIQTQVLLVFFLPLGMAAVHILIALKNMVQICSILSIGWGTVILCTIGTVLIFSLIYMGVYRKTAKVYYAIVDRQ